MSQCYKLKNKDSPFHMQAGAAGDKGEQDKRVCFICHGIGHISTFCPELKNLERAGGAQEQQIENAGATLTDSRTIEEVGGVEEMISDRKKDTACDCIHDGTVDLACGKQLEVISIAACKSNSVSGMPVCEGRLNDKVVSTLRDTG